MLASKFMPNSPLKCHAIDESEPMSSPEGARGHFPWIWLQGGWVGFFRHSQATSRPWQLWGRRSREPNQKAPVINEGPQELGSPPSIGHGAVSA